MGSLAPRVKAPSELLRAPVSLSDVNRNEREKIGMVGREAISMHGKGSSESNPTGETGKATEFRKNSENLWWWIFAKGWRTARFVSNSSIFTIPDVRAGLHYIM